MDRSIEDSLTLEGMDFDHSEVVVNQDDITLEDTGRLDTITMDMDDIGRTENLMGASNDEVIVSDLIEEPFPFQEYTIQCDTANSSNIMINPNQINILKSQSAIGSTLNLRTLLKAPAAPMSNLVTIKAQPKVGKRVLATAPPRQVPIAPKPVPKTIQYAIAPKPVALLPNTQNIATINKIPLTTTDNKSVLAQIGRQLVMVPKKIKLMPTNTSSSSSTTEGLINTSSSGLKYQMALSADQIQMMNTNKTKPVLKLIQVPGPVKAESSSSVAQLVPANVPRARYVMQQKTVPISIGGNKLQNVKIASKKQIISIKSSQNPQVVQTSQASGAITTKKVVISSNPSHKVVLRAATPSTNQTVKEATAGRTQFHPINIPGKGIQYIKLVTNQPAAKAAPKVSGPPKNYVFTDSKGNVIQMTAEKFNQSVLVSGASGKVVKTIKGQKKLVRIAPITKAVTPSTSQPARATQSLLAPPPAPPVMTSLPSLDSEPLAASAEQSYDSELAAPGADYCVEYAAGEFDVTNMHEETVVADNEETVDVKPTLESLISEAVDHNIGEEEITDMQNVEIKFEKKHDVRRKAQFALRDDSTIEHESSASINEDSIIIVPGNYTDKHNDSLYSEDSQTYRRASVDSKNVPLLAVSVQTECLPYDEVMPQSPHMSDHEAAATMELRPRKACNCTKSQCLKLYCDCFANGEFCNSCNCNNCHNNLENEEVRQKAIRSCLERNPNAFRPKIGKAKAGGPEIIRRHTKGCNCKRSGCLKNYCECYEAKIACTAMCKCYGCRNVEETLVRRRDALRASDKLSEPRRLAQPHRPTKQACSFITCEVIEAVCQCLLAAGGEGGAGGAGGGGEGGEARADPVADVIEEFARCLQDVITASHHSL